MTAQLADLDLKRPAESTAEAHRSTHPVVFFDGVCGFCNASINFLLACDSRGKLRFAPLQGVTAGELLPTEDRESLASMVVWTPAGMYRQSSAVVRILWILGGVWSLLGTLLWLVPRPIRDLGYNLVAKFRYRLFGKHETCRMPTAEARSRFLP